MNTQKIKNKIEIVAPNSYRHVQIPKIEKMPIDEFMALPPVFCQRQTDYRAPKIKKLLKKRFFPSHLDVAVFEYPCGARVKGNGNTRDVCWKEFKEDGDYHIIPSHVKATIYQVSNDDEARDLYYTFDSDDSVEKAPDKITGVYRALGLSFNTAKIAKGNIGKSLQYCSDGRDSNSTSSRSLDWFEVIKDFKDELTTLDKLRPKKHFDANIICAALMMLKRHGTTNPRLIKGLKQLNDKRKGAQDPKDGTDGITKILEEWDVNKIFEHKGTDGISMPRQQDFLICCFEKWMADEKVIIYRRPSECKPGSAQRGKGRRKNAYETFWDNEEN